MNLTIRTQHFGITLPARRGDGKKISEKRLHAKLCLHCEIFNFQKEKSESGYEHYQIYAKFRKDMCILDLREIDFGNAHFIPLLKTPEFMKYYCMKQSTRIGRVWKYDETDLQRI